MKGGFSRILYKINIYICLLYLYHLENSKQNLLRFDPWCCRYVMRTRIRIQNQSQVLRRGR